jgi:WXG100 family type VII secretion target
MVFSRGKMAEIIIPIDELFETARELAKGGKNTADLQKKLEKKMKNLEKAWRDSSKQRYYDYYRELDQQLGACSQIMDTMAREMGAIAERFAELNKE